MNKNKITLLFVVFSVIFLLFIISALVPSVSNVILSSTFGTNTINENLTVSYTLNESNAIGIINWYRNETSIMLLNMPFEGGSNSTYTRDYAFGSNGTGIGSPFWNATGGRNGTGAYFFDASDDKINTGSDMIKTKNMTICAWIKPIDWGGGTYGAIIHNGKAYFFASSTTFGNSVVFSSDNIVYVSGAINAITLNQWNHACVVRNTTVTFYVNGVKSGTANQNAGTPTAGTTNVYIGGRGADDNRNFNGTIDEVMIWNRSLSAEQISALYNKTDLIVSQEIRINETWKACVTPNNITNDGTTVCSNSITIGISSDAIPPNITIVFPQNKSYNTTSQTFTINVTDNLGVSSCWYSLNNGQTNITMSNISYNFTAYNITMSQGSHTSRFYCNDTINLINNSEQVTFYIDSLSPSITLIYPTSGLEDADSIVDFSFNASDSSNITSCSLYLDKVLTRTIYSPFIPEKKITIENIQKSDLLIWSVSCKDELNNSATSLLWFLDTHLGGGTIASGGGGGIGFIENKTICNVSKDNCLTNYTSQSTIPKKEDYSIWWIFIVILFVMLLFCYVIKNQKIFKGSLLNNSSQKRGKK